MVMMNASQHPIFATLFFFVLFWLFIPKPCTGISSKFVKCPEIEKQSLLSFKQSLQDPGNRLSSWNSEVNCCKWNGVQCSNLTGHVHQLNLQMSFLSGKVSPSLLNLKYLKYLDLSLNQFDETIPSFIGSLTSLEYLDVSHSEFHGKIPHNIGNLSNLHTLSFEDYYYIEVDSLEWLSRLSKLEHLNMNGVNLSRASNWAQQVINKLPSLVELHLSECSLNFTAPLIDVNITTSKLSKLDLSHNQFINSSIQEFLSFFKDLEYLDLAKNKLDDAIYNCIANLTSLSFLNLNSNELSGKLPKRFVTNLCELKSLDLSQNKFQGGVFDLFGNVSDCLLWSLESLDLNSNKLSGPLTHQVGEFISLQILILRNNSLSGVIPSNLGNTFLAELDLSHNKLTGNLPESIGQLSNLQFLYIEYNMLEGVVTETHFSHLSRLVYLVATENNLTLKVSPNWIPPFKLSSLHLGSWNLGSPIPRWLDTQKMSIYWLDLSNTGIYGNVPNWLWSISDLDLSHNQLHGKIPDIGDSSMFVYLGSNKLSGELPRVGKRLMGLDLSNNSLSGDLSDFLCNTTITTTLDTLILGGNHLTGELPNCFMNWPSLYTLNLENNTLSGRIPNSIGYLAGLKSLNLNGNNFSGKIPLSIHNCTELIKMDLSHNNLSGNLPKLILTSLTELVILILKSNKLSGEITSGICQLTSLQILDLSDNMFYGMIPTCVHNFIAMARRKDFIPIFLLYKTYLDATIATKGMELTYDKTLVLVTSIDLSKNNLSGTIPKEITSLVELRTLNLSTNHLTGLIPRDIGNMKQLESLDFSINSLSGELPISFTTMSFLDYLNVSYNNLTGRIPESAQLRGFNKSSFIGNNLCGPPLASSCSINDSKAPVTMHSKDGETDKTEIQWLYVFISLGYVIGLSAVLTALFLKRSWWKAYCELLDNIWDKVYVYVHIKWRRASGRNM